MTQMSEEGCVSALRVMNGLKAEGAIEDYAVGGGIAVLRYTEPFLTQDLDLFVVVEQTGGLAVLTTIYNRFRELGHAWHRDYLVVGGVPVQFIAADVLEAEAIKNAAHTRFLGVPTKVFTPEYLIAILVRAGRQKDRIKVHMLLEQTRVNKVILYDVLARYRLTSKFEELAP